jgi:hypothetical protein
MDARTKPVEEKQGADRAHHVAATPLEPVRLSLLGLHGVEVEAGTAGEWFRALRRHRELAREKLEWVVRLQLLGTVVELWAKERPWVRQVTVAFPKKEEKTLTLVIAVKEEGVSAEQHVEASWMGLAVSGALELDIEPRVVDGPLSEVPLGWMPLYRAQA